jgi:hypothetical protein
MDYTNKLLVVSLSISQWAARKEDKKVTREIEDRYQADRNSGNYQKFLLAQDAVKAYTQKANEIRTFHRENTISFEAGKALLPSENFLNHSSKIRKLETELLEIWEEFFNNYPDLVEQQRKRLNGLFKQEDYPNIYKLRKKFSFKVSFEPLPDASKFVEFIGSLQETEVKEMQTRYKQALEEKLAAATRELWERLYSALKHLTERLSDPEHIFRDTVIKNISELTELLPRLNFSKDPNLENMRQEIEKRFSNLNPETLRDNKDLRQQTAQEADEILKQMGAYYTPPAPDPV